MSFQGGFNLNETFIPPRKGVEYRGAYVLFKGDESYLGKVRYYPGAGCEEKIINAFLEKGPEVFSDLEHDFLLFLLIPSQKELYLVRDRFGIQPVYFKRSGEVFRFSQKVADLRESGQVSFAAIRRYLVDFADTEPVPDSQTFFNGIHTVPPGCYFYAKGPGAGHTPAYWRPEPEVIEGVHEPGLFGEFRERMFESVAFHTRNYERVSAHLSGGMDSSVIALVYSRITGNKFPTFYFDIADKDHRDPYYARLVSSQIGSNHLCVSPDSKDIFESVWKVSRSTGSPEVSILPSNIQYAIADESQKQGCQAILTGIDGDSVVGHGWAYLNSLKDTEDWELFIDHTFRRWMLHASFYRKGATHVRREIIEQELLGLLKAKEVRRFRNLMKVCRNKYGYVPLQFIAYLGRRASQRLSVYHPPRDKEYFLNKALRFENEEVYSSTGLYEHSDQEIVDNFRAAVNGEYPLHFEQFHAIGQSHGQQFLHPFFDRRLFELCLAIPDALRYGKGHTRWLMRNAMKDIIPAELLSRQDKDEFSLYMIQSCCDLWRHNRARFEENRELWAYIDKVRFMKQMNVLLSGKQPVPALRALTRKLSRVLYLGIWLDTLKC